MTQNRSIIWFSFSAALALGSGCDDMLMSGVPGGAGGGGGGNGGSGPGFCSEICEDNDDCPGAFCDETGACVDCLENTDCSPATPYCSAGTCIECQDDSDCSDKAQRPRCGGDGFCICASSADCTVPGLGECRASGCVCSDNSGCIGEGAETCFFGVCVTCNSDDDCGADASLCFGAGTPDSYCGCRNPSECAGDVCAEDGTCLECDDDQDCVDLGLGDACVDNTCTCAEVTACTAASDLLWVCEPAPAAEE